MVVKKLVFHYRGGSEKACFSVPLSEVVVNFSTTYGPNFGQHVLGEVHYQASYAINGTRGALYWKRGEVVSRLHWAAPPKASLLGRRASGTLQGTTGPWGPGAPMGPCLP